MNVAKWLLLVLLALPFLELATFIAVAAIIGFGWALGLLLAGSFAGALILRHGGGNHIARVRAAMDRGSFTAMHADSLTLTVGILLLVPGFITDVLAFFLLLPALFRFLISPFASGATAERDDDVIDLAPEQWHRVTHPAETNRHEDERMR